jgi:hypothetical protein
MNTPNTLIGDEYLSGGSNWTQKVSMSAQGALISLVASIQHKMQKYLRLQCRR